MKLVTSDPVIKIGGENYGVHTMDYFELKQFVDLVQDTEGLGAVVDLLSYRPMVTKTQHGISSNGTFEAMWIEEVGITFTEEGQLRMEPITIGHWGFDTSSQAENEGSWHFDPIFPFVYWYPCLIPLDQAGNELRAEFGKDNPDGSVIRALYIMANGVPVGMPDIMEPECITEVKFQHPDDLSLVEISGQPEKKPLEWVVLEGMLIPTFPVCSMPVRYAAEKLPLPLVRREA